MRQAQSSLLPGEQVPHVAGRDVSTCISLEKFPLYTCIKCYTNHRFLPHLWRWHSGAKVTSEQGLGLLQTCVASGQQPIA